MTPFPLKIVTPDGLKYSGEAERLTLRTLSGDMGILAGHINCVAPLGMGRAIVVIGGKYRYAACIGGMVSIMDGKVTLVPTTFEWAEDIDIDRIRHSLARAEAVLQSKESTESQIQQAKARCQRALVRESVVTRK